MAEKAVSKQRGPYSGAGKMKSEVQKDYLSRRVDKGQKDRKKSKDRLRYLLKKELMNTLSSAEKKEKKTLETKA